MDSIVNVGVIIFLGGVFMIIYLWQKKIEKNSQTRINNEKKEARDRGSHKALSQFPQINPYLCIGCGSCVDVCPEEDVIGMIHGVAQVVHGSRCIGHALCEQVCPVGAIKVGLGDIALRPDIPLLTQSKETTIHNIFIAGELGGLSLIRNAVNQGMGVIDEIAKRNALLTPSTEKIFDVVIIGAGPAGLTAGLRAIEKNLTYLVIDQDDIGGTIRKYPRRKMTLVQDLDIPLGNKLKGGEYEKEYLMEMWEGIVKKHNVSLRTKVKFLSLQKSSTGFALETSHGWLKSRHVLFALGRRGIPRRLNVPGENSKKVAYQLIDAASYEKQRVLIVGGGDSAIEAATALANQAGNIVTLSYRQKNFVRLKKRNEDRINEYMSNKKIRVLFESNVTAIEEKAVIIDCPSQPEKTIKLENDYVFIMAGGEPPFDLLKKVGIGFGGDQSRDKNVAA